MRNKLYDIWHGMIRRCHDPRRKDYPKYGGKGITVCEEWRQSFEEFSKWAYAHGYKDGMTLDRVNNKHGYSPMNCRWLSSRNQSYNRKSNHYLTVNGKTKTMEEWCNLTGLSPDCVLHRLQRGWSDYDAVMTPSGGRRKNAGK